MGKRKYIKGTRTKTPLDAEPQYHITLRLGNEFYEGKGDTIFAALQSIKKPNKLITKGILTLTHGDKRTERLMAPVRLKRLFWPNAQYLQAKWLAYGLK